MDNSARKICVAAVLGFILVGTGRAGAESLTFDDIPNVTQQGIPIPQGYGGLNWTNFNVLDSQVSPLLSGYKNGTISLPNVAFNNFGNPATVLAIGEVPFTLNSAYLTSAWNDGLQVEVQGFQRGILEYDQTFVVNTTAPTFINFNYQNVDQLTFMSSGGVHHDGYTLFGEQFALDNLTVNATVAEPSSLTLASAAALIGLGLVWYVRPKRWLEPFCTPPV